LYIFRVTTTVNTLRQDEGELVHFIPPLSLSLSSVIFFQPPIVPRIRHRGDPRNFFPDTTWGEV